MRTILICIIGICTMFTAYAQEIKENGTHKEFVYPGTQIYYISEAPSNVVINEITWKVTNGSFNEYNDITSTHDKYGVSVYWKNPKVSGSTIPKGTLSAEISYTNNGKTETVTKSLSQNIISYNGVTMGPLTVSGYSATNKTVTIPFGQKDLNVSLLGQPQVPYSTETNEQKFILDFEWTLPSAWIGSNNIIKNQSASMSISTDYFSEGEIKVRGVNPRYENDKTDYSSITIKREFSYSACPTTIQYGVSQTYTYTVPTIPNVTYEWSVPSGWTIVSGGNTNSIYVTKSPCATSADVKVRLKSGNKYSGWFTAPNTTILPPNITIPENIEQFRDVSISIDIPSDKIESFTITGPGVSIISGQGTNTLICRFKEFGSQEINVSVLLNGCETPFTFKVQVEVPKIQLNIDGPDVICSSDPLTTYRIDDLPSYATVTWSCSGGIEVLGNNSGESCNFRGKTAGNAQVRAVVNFDGSTLELLKNIEAASSTGNPYMTYTTNGNYINLTCHTPNIYGIREFIWNATATGSSGSSQSSHTGPGGYYWTLPQGQYMVECIVVTQCARLVTSTTIGGYRSSAYPNPADHTLYVNISDMLSIENEASTTSLKQNQSSKSYELRLFNFKGILVRNLHIQENETSIDVSGLPEGNYFLHILLEEGKEPEVHKVVIAH